MTLIALRPDDLHFIVSYDPERERSANRAQLVAVIEEFQALINDGVIAIPNPVQSAALKLKATVADRMTGESA